MPLRLYRGCADWWGRQQWRSRLAYVLLAAGVSAAIWVLTGTVRQNERSIKHLHVVDARLIDLANQNAEAIRQLKALVARQITVEVGVCALRVDLRQRVAEAEQRLQQSKVFLKRNPNGLLGFSAKAIQASIDQQQVALVGQKRTLNALSLVACPKR